MFVYDRLESIFIVSFTISLNLNPFFCASLIFSNNPLISDLNLIYPWVRSELTASLFAINTNLISYTHLYSVVWKYVSLQVLITLSSA